MKKIVGIIAAVAMAASVFAMDFSGGLQVAGNLFDMTFESGEKPSAFTRSINGGGNYWGSRVQSNFYGDKAGASIAFSLGDWGSPDLKWNPAAVEVYIQPLDILRISMLGQGGNLNSAFNMNIINSDGCAWKFGLTPIEGLSVDLLLANTWINKGDIQRTGLIAKYAADFGTIGALFVADNNFKDGKIGAGYSGTFDPVSMFVDVAFGYGANKGLAADFNIAATLDALKLQLYVQFVNTGLDFAVANDKVLVHFRLDYSLESAGIYLEAEDSNVLADKFGMWVKPGVTFNIGAASCNIGAKLSVADKTKLEVPFEVGVSW